MTYKNISENVTIKGFTKEHKCPYELGYCITVKKVNECKKKNVKYRLGCIYATKL